MHQEYFSVYTRLFSKLTYSFVAIELLAFFKNANSIFIAQENSRYFGFKNTPYVKKDWFFSFYVYKKVSQKKYFV